jgi:2Fe-2S ferredoxin
MPKIIFIEHDGEKHEVAAKVGKSLMRIAVDNMVPGILGDCGGGCNCATCHAYVDADGLDRIPPALDEEKTMLEGALAVAGNSRLTCQITMTEALDGIVIRLPESQV